MLCSPKASPPPPCPLNTTIFLFIYIISSLCLKQRKKMEQISEKNLPHPTGKKEKKSWCKRKKTDDTSSRHRLFSIYWAWKYDIKNFRILELCLPPSQGGNELKKNVIVLITSCTKIRSTTINCETEWISLKYETGKTEDLLMWQNINSII